MGFADGQLKRMMTQEASCGSIKVSNLSPGSSFRKEVMVINPLTLDLEYLSNTRSLAIYGINVNQLLLMWRKAFTQVKSCITP